MQLSITEARKQGEPIDAMNMQDAAESFLLGQQMALASVDAAIPAILEGAEVMAKAIRSGRSVMYAAAGSSALMALADASELPGTFGIDHHALKVFMAGGIPESGQMPGGTEDDRIAGSCAAQSLKAEDVVIVVSASGTTPYALAVGEVAKGIGAHVIAIANNAGSALLGLADVPICLETPPEVIAGSTRLGAGTAQKAALNLMSSLMGIKLGHVYQGMMVNVVADNSKLTARAAHIVSEIAGVSPSEAKSALELAKGHIKTAILIAAGSAAEAARDLLAKHDGHLGPCFQSLTSNQDVNV